VWCLIKHQGLYMPHPISLTTVLAETFMYSCSET